MSSERVIKLTVFVAAFIGCCFVVSYLSSVLMPFVVAWVIAYMLNPVVDFFQNKCRLRFRALCIVLTLLLAASLVAAFVYFCVPVVVEECVHLKNVAVNYVQHGARNATIPAEVEAFLRTRAEHFNVEKLLASIDLQQLLREALPRLWSFANGVAGMVMEIAASLIALLYLFFLLLDYDAYTTGWIEFVPERRRPIMREIVSDAVHSLNRYFRGQALVALTNTVMFIAGFLIVGSPAPIALGLFIGVISFVPYLQVIGIVPAAVLALLRAAETGQNFWMLIGGVVLVYIVVQIIQDVVFTPRIMGRMMGLRPAILLLALSIGAYIGGIVGLILALPLLTLAIKYYKRFFIA